MVKEFKPTCPFCHAEWSDENIKIEDVYASSGCDTCGYGSEVTGTVKIHCHECKKLMYQKDFKDRPCG